MKNHSPNDISTPQIQVELIHKYVDTRAGKIHIAQLGTQGEPIVFWPSIFYDISLFYPLCQQLSQRVVLIDGPGHGESELSQSSLTMNDCVEALRDVLDALNIRTMAAAGVSWGGVVMALFAAKYPERVSSAVLMNTPFDMPERPSLSTRSILAMTKWIPTWPLFKNGVARSFFSAQTHKDSHQVVDAFLAQPATFQNPGLPKAISAVLIERHSILPVLSQIACPVLVVAGAEDSMYPVDDMREQVSAIRNHQFAVVAGSAHVSAVEKPVKVAALIESFLARE